METTTCKVSGMTCGGCARAVRAAVEGVEGVIDVAVNLDTGDVAVRSDRNVRMAVAAAIEDAGYEVTQ